MTTGGNSARAAARAGRIVLAFLAVLLLALPALAQAPAFPTLSGRVVDAANIIPADRRAAIEAKLRAYEEKTSDQLVIATVPSLGGREVEDYANGLLRNWGLGTKARNNGALLLVAPSERKVRIEVGYGLEGALTDALSGTIIRTAIAPRFRTGDYAGGIEAGVDAILSIISGDAEEWQRRGRIRSDEVGRGEAFTSVLVLSLLMVVVIAIMRSRRGGPQHRRRRGGWIVAPPLGGGWGGGWSGGFGGGGFGGGGGFSGGGGSSGGGGASGSW